MSKYTDIIKRLKEARGPDSYLSTWVHTELQPLEPYGLFIQDCTASIDAALALVKEKLPNFNCWSIEMEETSARGVRVEATISRNFLPPDTPRSEWKMYTGESSTAPLAILVALFTALEEEKVKS